MKKIQHLLIPLLLLSLSHLVIANDGLAELAATSRAAALALKVKVPSGQGTMDGFGVFISNDGLALVDVGVLALKEMPTVMAADGTPLRLGAILGISPAHEVAVVKFKYRPAVWLSIAEAEPEMGEPIALVTLNSDDLMDGTIPPVVGQVTAKRTGMTSNLRENLFMRELSLGSVISKQQTTHIAAGMFAIDQKGNLIGFVNGTGVFPAQTLQYLNSVVALAKDIELLVKNGEVIPFPIPEAKNPTDLAVMDPEFSKMDLANRRGDRISAQVYLKALLKRYPTSNSLKLMAATSMVDPSNPLLELDNFSEPDPSDPPARQIGRLMARATILVQRNRDFEGAIRELEAAVAISPKDYTKSRQDLGGLYLHLGRLEKAENLFREMLPYLSDDIKFHEDLRRFLISRGKIDEAGKLVEKIARLEFIYQGRVSVKAPVSSKAISSYYHENQESFRESPLQLKLIMIRRKTEKEAQVKQRQEVEALARKIEGGTPFAEVAKVHSQDPYKEDGGNRGSVEPGTFKKDLDAAIFSAKPGIPTIHEDEASLYILMTEVSEEGRLPPLEEIQEDIKRILQEQKSNEWIQKSKEEANKKNKEIKGSIESYQRAIKLDPENASAHINLSVAFTKQGNLDEAIEALRRVIELDPDNSIAHSNLGFVFATQGNLDEAIRAFHRAIELDPENAMAHGNVGDAFFHQGNLDKAIEAYRRVIELDPENAMAHTNLGRALANLSKTEEAIEAYRRAIELDPKLAEAHNSLGYAMFKQGKTEDAIEACQRAIELDSRNQEAMSNLAMAHGKLGQVDRCGIWVTRLFMVQAMAQGIVDVAVLIDQIPWGFRQLKVEFPIETPLEEAVQDYYQTNEEAFSDSTIHLRMISGAKSAKTREFMETLRKKLINGNDFAAAAKTHSDDSSASDGGDRGWVKRDDLRADLEKAAFALKAGQFSEVIEDDTHFRLLNVVERKEGTPLPLSEVREKIIAALKEEAQIARIQGWIEEVKRELAEIEKANNGSE